MNNRVASTGSSLGGNIAPSRGSSIGGNTKSGGGSSINIKPTGQRGGSIAPSSSRGDTPATSTGADLAPAGSLEEFTQTREATSTFDHEKAITDLQEQYARLIEQKMYSQMLRTLVARENKEFQDWASGRDIKLNTPKDIQDFIDTFENGTYTNDAKLNGKIQKLINYIPDIVGALAKNQAIAPGAKIIAGDNPIVDEAKFGIEKVVAPTMKRVGELLEKRLGGNVGKQIGKSLISWGEKLATLPTKVLEGLGPADIVLSAVDAGLLAIDKATGNYRQQNHDLPEEVLGIPIVGQIIDSLSSVRDLIDTAGGVKRDDEAIPELYRTLQNDLWKPSIKQYNDVINELSSQEENFKNLATEVEKQSLRNSVAERVLPRIESIARKFGNNEKDIKEYINNELGITFDKSLPTASKIRQDLAENRGKLSEKEQELRSVKQDLTGLPEGRFRNIQERRVQNLEKEIQDLQNKIQEGSNTLDKAVKNDNVRFIEDTINDIIAFELGQKTEEQFNEDLQKTDVDIPEIKQTINGVEVQGRVALDNIYSTQDLIRKLPGVIQQQERELQNKKNELQRLINKGMRKPLTRKEADRFNKLSEEIPQDAKELEDLRTNLPSRLQSQLEGQMANLEDIIDRSRELGLDLGFLEKSKNWDKVLADLEDDTFFWEKTLGQFLVPGSGIGGL